MHNDRALKIFFVDDNDLDFLIFDAFIKKIEKDHEVFNVSTYLEAFDVLQKENFDICFFDFTLDRDYTAVDLIQAISDKMPYWDTPIIILTAHNNKQFVLETISNHVYDYLLKDEISASLLDRTIQYSLSQKNYQTRLQNVRHRQNLESLGLLTGTIAHEINNILQPIYLKADSIIYQTESDKIKHDAAKILEAAKIASETLSRLLSLSRVSGEDSAILDLRELLKTKVEFIQEMFPKSLQIEFDDKRTEKSKAPIQCNEDDFFSILSNFAKNSFDACEGSGRIIFSLKEEPLDKKEKHLFPESKENQNYYKIYVTDNGPGIEAAKISNIFTPFYTTKDVGEGSGLGLSIINNIITGWNGVCYYNHEYQKGAQFILILPQINQ